MRERNLLWRGELKAHEQREVDDLDTTIYDCKSELSAAQGRLHVIRQRAAARVVRKRKAEAAANADQR